MKEITMLLAKPNETHYQIITMKTYGGSAELYKIYNYLQCSIIDVADFQLNDGSIYSIICDDNGLLKDNNLFTLSVGTQRLIAGNSLITKYDIQGNNVGLSDNDIEKIISLTKNTYYKDYYGNKQMLLEIQST